MNKHKNTFIIFLSVICLVCLIGCDQIKSYFSVERAETESSHQKTSMEKKVQGPMASNVLVRIGDWQVTIDEFNERLKAIKTAAPDFDISKPESKQLILDELINQEFFVREAEKSGLAKDKEIQDAVKEFRRTLLVRDIAQKMTKDIKVTEEEMLAFYNENKQELVSPLQIRISEIVVDSQIKANELLTGLLKGNDFAAVAKENSIGTTASAGGDLGYLTEEPFPEMVAAIAELQQGEISNVFKGPEGFYIVKMDERKGGEVIDYETIKEDIRQNRMIAKQQDIIRNYLEQAKKQTKIEVNKELLK